VAFFAGGGFRAMEELRDSGAVSAIGTGGGTFDSISAMLEHCSIDYICLPTSYTLLGQVGEETGLSLFLSLVLPLSFSPSRSL
jgi:D-threo-aldose 1-dehydrogenase